MVMAQAQQSAPNCLVCRQYFVTYKAHQPHGCRAYGFTSKELPSRVVYASSGRPCQLFVRRTPV